MVSGVLGFGFRGFGLGFRVWGFWVQGFLGLGLTVQGLKDVPRETTVSKGYNPVATDFHTLTQETRETLQTLQIYKPCKPLKTLQILNPYKQQNPRTNLRILSKTRNNPSKAKETPSRNLNITLSQPYALDPKP